MRRILAVGLALAVVGAPGAAAQFGGGFGGGRGGGGRGGPGMGGRAEPAPKMPGAELAGPPDSAAAQALLSLTNQQAGRYAQAYDSFMTATKPSRDSVALVTEKMHDRLSIGDRAAATFYAGRLLEIGDYLKGRQEKFENGPLRHILSGDQVKAYRRWKEDQDRIYEEKNREEALRWQQRAPFGERGGLGDPGGFGVGGRVGQAPPEQRTATASVAGVGRADLGSQAVRVGRTVYITAQLPVDSLGALVNGDLRAQADWAFANLATVLHGVHVQPEDIVALTIYLVGYKPEQLEIVRAAGAAYFGANAPTATVLGVQALAREGALIAVAATAVEGTTSWFDRMAGSR